jgi:phosphoglycerate dehydrogenase-like enzyme
MPCTLILTQRSRFHQEMIRRAAPPGFQIRFLHPTDRAAIIAALPGVEFLFSDRAGVIDAPLIVAGRDLRLIQRLGSLIHDIDLDAARRAGVPVASWPLLSAIRVAEHAVMLMLALSKRLLEAQAIAASGETWGREPRRTDENTFAYNWSGRRGIGGLWRQTVGILGCGEIGVEMARRLHGWGCTVLYNRRHRFPAFVEAELGIAYAEKEDLLAQSDYLVSLLPYTPETVHYLNAERLARLKPTACLVHCGSGGVVDEPALAEALSAGKLAGAALDTYEWEPLKPDNPLLRLPNVILTPHIAGGDTGDYRLELEGYFQNARRVLAGEPILHRVA